MAGRALRESPHRRAGVAIVPIFDVDAAVSEIRRARESGLRGGILIPSMRQPYEPYHDAKYDPVWAVCSELEMPVHVHSGAADRASYGEHVGIYIAEVRWWSTRPLWFLLWAGTFERFPSLTFVTTECGAFWAPDLLWTNDIAYDREHAAKKLGKQLTDHLSMRPSEYFDRNCYIGASNTRRRVRPGATRSESGTSCGATISPIPRDLAPYPGVAGPGLLRHPGGRDPQILGTNAAECYHFDTKALQSLAERTVRPPTSSANGATISRSGRSWRLPAGRG